MTDNEVRILYLVNFYGTPPLNFFEIYLKENRLARLTILKLPSVRPMKSRFMTEAFLKNPDGSKKEINFSIWFPFPLFIVFVFQYFYNSLILFYLLIFSSDKKFEIGIGETQFGSSVIYILKLLGIVKYGVYMNGDTLPPLKKDHKPFYFTNTLKNQLMNRFILEIDRTFLQIQYFLRSVGFRNDLIWYPTESCYVWDIENGFKPKDYIISPTVLMDSREAEKNAQLERSGNSLAYIGRLDEHAGMDMALQVVKEVKSTIPDIKLIVVGGGSLTVDKYKEMASELNILDNIVFHGYVADMDDAYDLLMPARLGLALYKPAADNVSLSSEPSKPKEYIKLGIPVVMTRGGPKVGYVMEKAHASLLCDYDAEDIARTVVSYLTRRYDTDTMKKGVIEFAIGCDYRTAFDQVTQKLLNESRSKWTPNRLKD